VRTARTDFDGFFLFERVAYGRYSLRVAGQSAAAARIGTELGVQVVVTPDKPAVRLGAIRARASALLASAAGASP